MSSLVKKHLTRIKNLISVCVCDIQSTVGQKFNLSGTIYIFRKTITVELNTTQGTFNMLATVFQNKVVSIYLPIFIYNNLKIDCLKWSFAPPVGQELESSVGQKFGD